MVGRGDDCEISIPARTLSRHHAILLVEEGEHFVKDLGGCNFSFRRGVSCCCLLVYFYVCLLVC